jgi:hypothetical protein
MKSQAVRFPTRNALASLAEVRPDSSAMMPARDLRPFIVPSGGEHSALERRIDALDVTTLRARPGADPVARLEVAAKAVCCTPPRLAVLLARFPDVRAWVVCGA